jgi:hypothetical protein
MRLQGWLHCCYLYQGLDATAETYSLDIIDLCEYVKWEWEVAAQTKATHTKPARSHNASMLTHNLWVKSSFSWGKSTRLDAAAPRTNQEQKWVSNSSSTKHGHRCKVARAPQGWITRCDRLVWCDSHHTNDEQTST